MASSCRRRTGQSTREQNEALTLAGMSGFEIVGVYEHVIVPQSYIPPSLPLPAGVGFQWSFCFLTPRQRDVSSPPECGPSAAVDSLYPEGSIATPSTPKSLPIRANPTLRDTWSSRKPAPASTCPQPPSQTPRRGRPGGAARKRGGLSN